MIHFAAALLAAATPYPEAAVADAFHAVCVAATSQPDMRAAALASGWVERAPPAGGHFARLADVQRNWKVDLGVANEVTTFARTVAGRELWLLVSKTAPYENWPSRADCALFDFAAAARLSDATVARFRSGDADEAEDSPQIWFRHWSSSDDRTSFRAAFIPPGSSLVQGEIGPGVSLQASYNLETE